MLERLCEVTKTGLLAEGVKHGALGFLGGLLEGGGGSRERLAPRVALPHRRRRDRLLGPESFDLGRELCALVADFGQPSPKMLQLAPPGRGALGQLPLPRAGARDPSLRLSGRDPPFS